MKHKVFFITLFLEALGSLGLSLLYVNSAESIFMTIATFPFSQIANLLRYFSLSGELGNVLSWILFVFIGAVPLIFLSVKIFKKKFRIEDILLAVLSTLILFTLYLMVNPAYLSDLSVLKNTATAYKATLGLTVYSVLIGYFVFKFIRTISDRDTFRLLKLLKVLLFIAAMVMVYIAFGAQVSGLLGDLNSVSSGNSDTTPPFITGTNPSIDTLVSVTNILLITFCIIDQIPTLFAIYTVFLSIKLLDKLSSDRYGNDTVIAANRLVSGSKMLAAVSMLACITENITQLIFSRFLLKINTFLLIPLIPVALALILLLFARYFAQSNEIKQDMDLFV